MSLENAHARMQRWLMPWVTLVCLTLLVASACRVRDTDSPLSQEAARAEIQRLEAHLEKHPDDRDAWRDLAHLHWLHVNETDEAIAILDRLSKVGDPTAQLSRTIIAHNRLDAATVWTNSTKMIETLAKADLSKSERRLREPLTESAVRFLDEVMGDQPGDDERFVKFFDGVNLAPLPPAVRQPLLSLRAGIARRHGDDYRTYYEQQGCIREWAAGPVEGHLGEIELRLRDADRAAFEPDPQASVAALSCVVRVWNPAPRAGIRRLRTVIEPTSSKLRLDIAAQNAVRVYLDGERIHRTDRVDRWPSRHTVLELGVRPGPHTLEIRTAIPEDKSWILVRATDERGNAIKTSPDTQAQVKHPYTLPRQGLEGVDTIWPQAVEPLAASLYIPLREYLAVDDALADGDSDRAETHASALRASVEGFSAGHLVLAEFEDADPSRGRNASASRRQLALQAAVAKDPLADRARLQLLELRLENEGSEVITALAKLGPDRLATVDGYLLRWNAYLDRGSELMAEQALTQAAKLDAESCKVLLAQRRMARRLSQVTREDELVGKLERCSGTLKLRSRLAIRRGQTEAADALLETQIGRIPDDIEALESRAAVALVERRYEDAIAFYEQILEFAPFRASAHVEIADALAQAGAFAAARNRVRQAIAMLPHHGRLREIGETLGIEDPLMHWRENGAEALEGYRRGAKTYEGVKTVLVLDRDVAEVYASGGQRHVVHQIIHLLSKESLDVYGEVSVPNGARILTMQSIKADGTIVEPEAIAGKDGLSLRNLEIGDFVEMEYVLESEPFTVLPGHVDLSRFRFQSLDTPFHKSELVVLAPEDMKILVESRNGAPEVKRRTESGRQVLSFLAKQMPRRGPEPQARSMLDELPSVRVYTHLDVTAWLNSIALQMRPAQRSNPELRQRVAEIIDGRTTEFAKIDAIYRWVMQNVEEGGDLTTHATRTLAAREGNRLMLLRAMVREAGLRSEVWLARDAFGASVKEGGHPMVEAYEAPILAVWLDGYETPLILATLSKTLAPGYLLPSHSGTQALRVQLADDERAPGPETMPRTPKRLADRRSYDLAFDLDERGNGSVRGTIELQGMEAALWRNVLDNIDEDRREERFQQGELSVIARGAGLDLQSLEIENEAQLEAPLVLRFEAAASGIGVVQGGDLVVPAALVPMNLGLGYTQLPERWSGMIVPYAPLQEARVSINFASGRLRVLPPEEDIKTKHGSYLRKISADAQGSSSVIVETRATLTVGIVEAEEYGEMAELTREIQTAEQGVLRVK